jgi:HK97 family phage portal protein
MKGVVTIGLFRKRKQQQEIRAEPMTQTTILTLEGLIGSTDKVTRAQAMEIPTVGACISKIGEEIAKLPVRLYRRDGEEVTEITDDPRLRLLNGETGDTLSTVDMWKAAVGDYYLGRGAWIFVDSDGLTVRGLHYVDSRSIGVLSNADPIFKSFRISVGGQTYYDFQFIRLLRRTYDGWTNIPLQEDSNTAFAAAYNSLKLENQMNAKGGCQPGFLKSEKHLSSEAITTIRETYKQMYSNDNSDQKIVVLNGGIDFQPASTTAAEMQLNENKRTSSTELCKLFGFPHTVIDGGATEDDNRKYIAAVVALLNQIETALDAVLLLESEKDEGYYWAFDTKELTRGSMKERFDAYEVAVRNNILQIDEIRREEDYEPLGFNFVKLGLSDVLLNPETMEVFTPNTGQTKNLLTGEERAEELRGWVTINGKHLLLGDGGDSGGGGSKGGGKSGKKVDKSEKPDIIKLEDIEVGKSVGAKAKNYEILDPSTGEYFKFAEGTKIQNAEVFAGKGCKKALDKAVAEGLEKQIGGKADNWQHAKGHGIIDYYGEERPA